MEPALPSPSSKHVLWITRPAGDTGDADSGDGEFGVISYRNLALGIELCLDRLDDGEKAMANQINSYYQVPYTESAWESDDSEDPCLFVDATVFRSLLRLVSNGTAESRPELSLTLRQGAEFLDSLGPHAGRLKLEVTWGW